MSFCGAFEERIGYQDGPQKSSNFYIINMLELKTTGKNAFGKYQAFGVATQKWQPHDQLVNVFHETRRIEYVRSGLYENANELYKKFYKNSQGGED